MNNIRTTILASADRSLTVSGYLRAIAKTPLVVDLGAGRHRKAASSRRSLKR